MFRPSTRSVATAVAAALLVASCGSGDGADTTTTDAPASTEVVSAEGTEFSDPDGAYTITVGPEWAIGPGDAVIEGLEVWSIDSPNDNVASNVNILTQSVAGLDLAAYLDVSVENFGSFEVIDQQTVTGENGNELGVLEYTGAVAGSDPLHFLAVVDVEDETAVLATFTTTEADFETLRESVEPFLLTLQAT